MFDFKSFTENLAATFKALTPKITIPFAAAAWILLYIHFRSWMILPPVVVVSALVVGVLFSCLAVVGLLTSLWNWTRGLRKLFAWMFLQRVEKIRIEGELEFLIPQEREIIAYLLAKNQKMFEVLPDGEQAATLIAKGFVTYQPRGHLALRRDIAVEVPNHVWEVLAGRRAEFPYHARDPEKQPWRT